MTKPATSPAALRRVAFASLIGTTIEWYDFFLYGAASALVFNKLFFPEDDPLTGTLKAYGTYAVGFVARPVGGIVCGHYGDRIGRKSMLILTLLIMGISTFFIGLIPPASQIGIWAPILLITMRIAQGFGVGGEWGGAVLMAVEHAPHGKRGFYGSWPQIGVPAGLVLSSLVFALLSKLPEDDFLSWGWRIAFLLSILMIAVGIFIRLAVEEPPVFKEIKDAGAESAMPIFETIRKHPKNLLVAMGARIADNAVFYLYTTFILTYATQKAIGFEKAAVLNAISIAAGLEIIAIPFFGWLSDRLGRRPVYLFGTVFTALFAFPYFWLINTSNPQLLILSVAVGLVVGHAAMYGPQASFFCELFGTKVRYTGASVGYQLASVFAGGFSPIIATALLKKWETHTPVAFYIVGLSVLSTIAIIAAAETAHHEIGEAKAE